MATVAVKDIDVAARFYKDVLGLALKDQRDGVRTFGSGTSDIVVYVSEYAGTNKATTVTWNVGNEIETIVQALRTKGVAFERYDMPQLRLEGDIYVGDGMKVAWLKDPDGNILCLVAG